MVRMLVDVQAGWIDRVPELEALGVPDPCSRSSKFNVVRPRGDRQLIELFVC